MLSFFALVEIVMKSFIYTDKFRSYDDFGAMLRVGCGIMEKSDHEARD